MPGMRATSSSVMLMIALGLVGKPLRRRSPGELIWERRRRCLCRRPRTMRMTVRDVRPTAPTMIPTSKYRLIAMTRQGPRAGTYEESAESTGVGEYLTVLSTARAP